MGTLSVTGLYRATMGFSSPGLSVAKKKKQFPQFFSDMWESRPPNLKPERTPAPKALELPRKILLLSTYPELLDYLLPPETTC